MLPFLHKSLKAASRKISGQRSGINHPGSFWFLHFTGKSKVHITARSDCHRIGVTLHIQWLLYSTFIHKTTLHNICQDTLLFLNFSTPFFTPVLCIAFLLLPATAAGLIIWHLSFSLLSGQCAAVKGP